jgi:tRNA-Thr(GGU) m(6)t(6)A37 methyltransferase TsaA
VSASYLLQPVGRVESPLEDLESAPLQGDEGSPEAWLVLEPGLSSAWQDLQINTEVLLLTWLDRADRSVLAVHPRGDRSRPLTGVFSTRSPDRPNPIGLHRVRITAIESTRIRVQNLEALDGTPILDIKPILSGPSER